jgi:hypothetical protein
MRIPVRGHPQSRLGLRLMAAIPSPRVAVGLFAHEGCRPGSQRRYRFGQACAADGTGRRVDRPRPQRGRDQRRHARRPGFHVRRRRGHARLDDVQLQLRRCAPGRSVAAERDRTRGRARSLGRRREHPCRRRRPEVPLRETVRRPERTHPGRLRLRGRPGRRRALRAGQRRTIRLAGVARSSFGRGHSVSRDST